MPIILKSDANIRAEAVRYLQEKKRTDPSYKVIDVGGSANPWCDGLVDAYVDIVRTGTGKQQFIGDINTGELWVRVSEKKFDFSICTHTLEDIRDPAFVLGRLMEISKAGFIAVPNKHTEMSNIESEYWLGYCHHRWIFTIRPDNGLLITPKFPLTSYFSRGNRLAQLLGGSPPGLIHAALRRLGRTPVAPGLRWVDKEKVRPGFELGILWEESFPFRFANGDYAGKNVYEAASLYTEGLAGGI